MEIPPHPPLEKGGWGDFQVNLKSRSNFYYLLFSIFFLSIFLLSCTRYPTIPKMEEIKGGKEDKVAEKKGGMGEAFQKRAVALIPTLEGKEKDYVIGPEDVLKIMVWDHDDLSREIYVSSEGEFSYPLIGKVHADGLTLSQLEKRIKDLLFGRYIVNPQVTITVKEYKSKRVFVLGEVGGPQRKGLGPGDYPLTGKTRLVEVLSLAGGPTQDAGAEIIVVRPRHKRGNPTPLEEAGEDEIISINLRRLLEGDTSQNIYLEPDDSIYVPKAEFFFVFGEVKAPGRYNLEKGTTVLKAITTAGGITEKAAINKTKIVREEGGAKLEISVKMTDPVLPEDILMVPESFF